MKMEKEKIKDGIQSVVTSLYQKHGGVKPSMLVEAAKPKTSPAHEGFEWNNSKAGHEFRLIQARTWIRKIEIVIDERPPERLVHIPVYTLDESDVKEREGYYRPISIVAGDEYEYMLALSAAKTRVIAAKAAYEELKKAATKFKADTIDFKKADQGFKMIESALPV